MVFGERENIASCTRPLVTPLCQRTLGLRLLKSPPLANLDPVDAVWILETLPVDSCPPAEARLSAAG